MESMRWEFYIVRDYTVLPDGLVRAEIWDQHARRVVFREFQPNAMMLRAYSTYGIRSELRDADLAPGRARRHSCSSARAGRTRTARRTSSSPAASPTMSRSPWRTNGWPRRPGAPAPAQRHAVELQERVDALAEELESVTPHRALGRSRTWRDVLAQATKVAETDTTVLITGESGTGKEVVARYIHRASGAPGGPSSRSTARRLPEQLLESELFGYERGAFTGAQTGAARAGSSRRRAASSSSTRWRR